MTTEYLSNIDTALLKLDHPTNLMMITGVLILQDPVDLETLKDVIRSRLLKIPRFRQRVVWPRFGLRNPYWQEDPYFQLNDHVQPARLPEPGDRNALNDLINLLASSELDVRKPLWQFHLVENYQGGSALIGRLHHAIADGMALLATLLSISDPEPVETLSELQSEMLEKKNRKDYRDPIQKARQGIYVSSRAVRKKIHQGRQLLSDPDRQAELKKFGQEAAEIISWLLLREPDSKTVLNGELGICKRTAWSKGIALADIRIIQDVLGGTVNDVLVSAITGAMRSYIENHTDRVDELTIHATVPVNLRHPRDFDKLGNRMGAVFLALPIDITDPIERLKVVKERMDESKQSLEAPVIFNLLNALGMTNSKTANTLIKLYSTRATAVITNVRGPQERLKLAGSEIESVYAWVPTTGRLGIGVSILSYSDEVRLGVITDERLVPDPGEIIQSFYQQFDQLLAIVTQTSGVK